MLDVPAAAVALKDEDRPFLAGSVGLEATDPDQWWGATPLSLAVSDQVSAERGALMVEDLAARELLAADPMHREHGFRALLAIPLNPGPEAPQEIDVGELVRDVIELIDPPAKFQIHLVPSGRPCGPSGRRCSRSS